MRINGKEIDEAKLNGKIVFRLDRDRIPPEVKLVKIQRYYPLIYPSIKLFPSKNIFPKKYKSPNCAELGDTILVEIEVSELLRNNPIVVIGNKEFELNLTNEQNKIYSQYIILTNDMNLIDSQKIEITIKNLVDLTGNKAEEILSTGDNGFYVYYNSNFI